MSTLDIGWAYPAEYPALQKIWCACFGDTPDSVGFFFENYLPHCRVLTARADGIAVGGVYLISASVKDGVETRPAFYVYALGVLPAYRSQGIGSAIMNYILTLAKNENAVCLLSPAAPDLVPYYSHLGMRETYFAKMCPLTPNSILPMTQSEFSPVTAAEYARVRRDMPILSGAVFWEFPHVSFAVAENYRSCGFCGKYTADGKTMYVFLRRQNDGYCITETLPSADAVFLSGLCAHFPGENLFLRLQAAADDPKSFVLGMTYNMHQESKAPLGLLLD